MCNNFFIDRCDIYNSHRHQNHAPSMPYANGGLHSNSRSRSVPEGLAHPNGDIHWNYNRNATFSRPPLRQQQHVQVLEQLTTTV